jgi:trans-aconitate methyltransferase
VSLVDTPRYSHEWLELREPADAAARATGLLDRLRSRLAGVPEPVIRDLGCGSGAMGRWLASRLTGPQHWVLHDRDPDLLDYAAGHMPATSADGAPVTVTTEQSDVALLTAGDLAGTSLVTASALLDLLTLDEVDRLAAACAGAGCAALLTLTVVGRVEMTPAEPLDAELSAAFNDHLRHNVDGRHLLGPDAATATADAFARQGVPVQVRPSVWQLDAKTQAPLIAEWLRGWVPAAAAQRPALADHAEAYLSRRLAASDLRVTVHHSDLLALPGAAA